MDIGTTDFMLPALTVQPLVENAVKWGIGKRENGGTVRLATRMTPLGGWNTCARRRQRCLFWRCRSRICSRRRAWQPPEDRWKC